MYQFSDLMIKTIKFYFQKLTKIIIDNNQIGETVKSLLRLAAKNNFILEL